MPQADGVRVACIGGATVDRSYRLAAPLIAETSNPATAHTGFGGVARNVAGNLARAGVSVDLVSRVGDDVAGWALVAALDAAGIGRSGVAVAPGEATADYVAVLTPGGDLALGLAAMAVLDGLTPDALAAHAPLLAAADWVFADCNLPAATLHALARRSLSPDWRYRLAVDAVSVAKAARLPVRLDGIDLLFANRDEAEALAAHRGLSKVAWARPRNLAQFHEKAKQDGVGLPTQSCLVAERPTDVAAALLRAGARAVVVTLGAEGAVAASAGGIVAVDAVPARVLDVTGAGDALVAATLDALMGGAALTDAVARGCAAAAATVARPGTGEPEGDAAELRFIKP